MTIQSLTSNVKLFARNNSQVSTPKRTFISNNFDTVSFKAKENNGLLNKLRAAALAIPLVLGSTEGNAIVHPYLDSSISSTALPTQSQPAETKPNDQDPPAVDNEYLRVLACLKDTTKPGGNGYLIDTPQSKINLFLDKKETPYIKVQLQNAQPIQLAIDPHTGQIKYPASYDSSYINAFEALYNAAINTILESGQCDAHLNDMTID